MSTNSADWSIAGRALTVPGLQMRVRSGDPLFSYTLFGVYIAVILWVRPGLLAGAGGQA